MSIPEHIKKRRHDELVECFTVIDTCLGSYYQGATHMYRPLSVQLRILYCDRNPLLTRVFPDLQINPLKPIEWLEPSEVLLFRESAARLSVGGPPEATYRLARMPFMITSYSNGLQVADLELVQGQLLPVAKWLAQIVTIHPGELSIRDLIRSVANKGGGAHVDDEVGVPLTHMMAIRPRGLGSHVLFPVALARFAQQMGLFYAQFPELYGYSGSCMATLATSPMRSHALIPPTPRWHEPHRFQSRWSRRHKSAMPLPS